MIFYVLLSLLAGALQTVQTAFNTRLGKDLKNPIFVSVESCAIGAVALALAMLVTRKGPPGWSLRAQQPWWLWFGGTCGATFVLVSVVATPKLSVGTVTALVIAGQILLSIVFDHFGVLGLERHPLNAGRITAVLLFCVGAELLRRSS